MSEKVNIEIELPGEINATTEKKGFQKYVYDMELITSPLLLIAMVASFFGYKKLTAGATVTVVALHASLFDAETLPPSDPDAFPLIEQV
ncbi:unnamed protein product [Leptidea sinapis]|nr:unnamed protein product [Leptidea sinapis]